MKEAACLSKKDKQQTWAKHIKSKPTVDDVNDKGSVIDDAEYPLELAEGSSEADDPIIVDDQSLDEHPPNHGVSETMANSLLDSPGGHKRQRQSDSLTFDNFEDQFASYYWLSPTLQVGVTKQEYLLWDLKHVLDGQHQ
ncbi:hypothetical protein C8R44DRAFT_748239 [Mycena epipterygia]|nr:hypothetical protein C8R44DRAFT_748239 [Mycena epipterygia]